MSWHRELRTDNDATMGFYRARGTVQGVIEAVRCSTVEYYAPAEIGQHEVDWFFGTVHQQSQHVHLAARAALGAARDQGAPFRILPVFLAQFDIALILPVEVAEAGRNLLAVPEAVLMHHGIFAAQRDEPSGEVDQALIGVLPVEPGYI